VADGQTPRKLIAFREVGQVRLRWKAPPQGLPVAGYQIERSEGFSQPYAPLARCERTEYIDKPPVADKTYYYRVRAIYADDQRSRPSNEDNAKALSHPRLFDAQIAAQIPAKVRRGELHTIGITVRNAGSRTWNLADDKGIRFVLKSTQQWGCQDEGRLPEVAIRGPEVLRPNEAVTLQWPMVGPAVGCFENHWIVCLDVPGKPRAYIGTPLLADVEVTEH
jgi:hypothetical protein